MVGMKFVTTGP